MPHAVDPPPKARSDVGLVAGAATALLGFGLISLYVVLSGGSSAAERSVAHALTAERNPTVAAIARVITTLASGPVLVTVGLIVAAVVWRRRRRWFLSALLVGSLAVTAGLVTLCKMAFARVRPDSARVLGTPSTDYAFPSGHTTNGTVTFVLVAVVLGVLVNGRRTRVLMVAVAVVLSAAVGWTRVYLGYHWPTDVLGGWCLAGAVICSTLLVVRSERRLPGPLPSSTGALVRDTGRGRAASHR